MATTRDERQPVTWEDLLAAINPSEESQEENVWRAIDEVTAAWQDGYITHEEATALIRLLMSANVEYEMGRIIGDAFSSNERGKTEMAPRRWRFAQS